MANNRNCRFCETPLEVTFVDLGMSPLANSYLKPDQLARMEPHYPLHTFVCSKCFLVQLEEFEAPDHIFSDYAYFSSFSESWLKHAEQYSLKMIPKAKLHKDSLVVELASNDGYLLQYFKKQNIPVLGIEPAKNVAKVAIEKGIPTETVFFGRDTAQQLASKGHRADLIAANNVLAHVPDLLSFVEGMKILLKPSGTITVEFPHLVQLVKHNQFDTIYHEHFSYFSFTVVKRVFEKCGLKVFDVEELSTHGGSLRVFAAHSSDETKTTENAVTLLLEKERSLGVEGLDYYRDFSEKVKETKRQLLEFLIEAKRAKKSIVGYGAPAKGNTLLNYCGIRTDFIDYTVDRSTHKQGHYLPGTHIPVVSPDQIFKTKPDYVLILPWNLKTEIQAQMYEIRSWGGKFVVPIPSIEVVG